MSKTIYTNNSKELFIVKNTVDIKDNNILGYKTVFKINTKENLYYKTFSNKELKENIKKSSYKYIKIIIDDNLFKILYNRKHNFYITIKYRKYINNININDIIYLCTRNGNYLNFINKTPNLYYIKERNIIINSFEKLFTIDQISKFIDILILKEVENREENKITILSCENKLETIKIIKDHFKLSLQESKEIIDNLPYDVDYDENLYYELQNAKCILKISKKDE